MKIVSLGEAERREVEMEGVLGACKQVPVSGSGFLKDETGRDRPLSTGDFALVLPGELHQYRNDSTDRPLVMICLVPREFE